MNQEDKQAWIKFGLKDLGTIIITAMISVTSTYYTFKTEEAQITVQQMELLYSQANADREKLKELAETVSNLRSEVLSLKVKLAQKYDSVTAFKRSLDRMPFPVFIKVESIEDGQIMLRNWHVNSSYRQRFNVTAERYRGKTDFEIWEDQKVAQQFYEFDLRVLQMRNHLCSTEIYPHETSNPVSHSNPLYQGKVCKWYDEIEGRNALVGAVITESPYNP